MDLHSPFDYVSLCSGGGGLDMGLRLAVPDARCVCYVEIGVQAAALLVAEMQDGALDGAPLWSDLRTFNGRRWRRRVDGIIGGIPCQPFSVAGQRKGDSDARNLWPDALRVVYEVQPGWCWFENVPGMANKSVDWYYFRSVRPRLQEMGYAVTEGFFTAAEVGAPHDRERLFILAHAAGGGERERFWESQAASTGAKSGIERCGSNVADSAHERHERDRITWNGRTGSALPGAELANAINGGRAGRPPDPRGRAEGRTSAPGTGSAMGDADGMGLAFRIRSGGDGETPREAGRPDARSPSPRPFQWPPGYCKEWERGRWHDPGECRTCDEWRAVIAVQPDLAPATQSSIRDVADGLASGLARRDRLSILGNGVVPAQAALAWRVLYTRLGAATREDARL